MNDQNGEATVRFVDAEQVNPSQVLLDLHHHALGRPAAPSPQDALTKLAPAAAVLSWWRRWQPMTIHAALRRGADLADIAATGLDVAARDVEASGLPPAPPVDPPDTGTIRQLVDPDSGVTAAGLQARLATGDGTSTSGRSGPRAKSWPSRTSGRSPAPWTQPAPSRLPCRTSRLCPGRLMQMLRGERRCTYAV